MSTAQITILPAPNCRRSRKIMEYLERHHIPFTRIEPDSPHGQELQAQYEFRASPGILVNGASINPFDLLIQPGCRVNEEEAQRIFTRVGT